MELLVDAGLSRSPRSQELHVLVYRSAVTVSAKALRFVAGALRRLGTRWRRLSCDRQALMVLAHLRKGETYRDLAVGFGVGTTTTYQYLREGLNVLAGRAGHRRPGRAAGLGLSRPTQRLTRRRCRRQTR
jgi:hypothetical protein